MLKPLGDRLVIEVIEVEEKTASGLILTETAKEKPQQGKVVAVGNGVMLPSGERVSLDVKVDDQILFDEYAGKIVKYQGQEYLILRESDVLAIVE
ncbi:10 kDa chaperonin [Lysinibacillus alkalisoli]|uniref:Co-chaperonin GroES n=1 Tax=Lysinibacillus alkalisoli TaxID=1911548 RepID=A0A917G9E8_9BACI|nr:co-chaperone GroES [Lysinibacillus alkalisoli]GGG31093.1 10 kDa chaperonin [Lysinibacillus alkalisoli]